MQTKYFGEYNEQHTDKPAAEELVGKVIVKRLGNNYFPYLEIDGTLYDLPMFMITYANLIVAVMGRKYRKTRGNEYTYNKLLVVRVKRINSEVQNG